MSETQPKGPRTARAEPTPSRTARRNVQAVLKSLEKTSARRNAVERMMDRVAGLLGTPGAFALHACVYGGWLAWNGIGVFGLVPFDPPPFSLLTLVVSLEAILLSLLVLVSQNRIRTQAEHQAHVDLQVNLMAEQEATKMLGLLRSLCARFGLKEADDAEIADLMQSTDPESLFDHVGRNLSERN